MGSLREKVALITGASSGIGAGTATHFASLGCYLALCGRNKENLEKTGKQCEANGLPKDKILLIQGDLSKEEDCKAAVEKTIKYFGRLDSLINNAGIALIGSIETTSLEQFDAIMNINVRSMFHITMLAIRPKCQTSIVKKRENKKIASPHHFCYENPVTTCDMRLQNCDLRPACLSNCDLRLPGALA
ncbi:uncharacterized protein [Ptychodera flava]|uniref:uncharacterized protein n=1 Tax=Ptychodera flava TaxID=63121 RepID=UPI003969DA7C